MSNRLETQVVEEGPRNAIVKLVGMLDSSNVAQHPAVSLAMFQNNDPQMKLVGLRVDCIDWSISGGMEVNLNWDSNSDQLIACLAGQSKLEAKRHGGLLPDQLASGYSGNINLDTTNYSPGVTANFTIMLAMVKLYKRGI